MENAVIYARTDAMFDRIQETSAAIDAIYEQMLVIVNEIFMNSAMTDAPELHERN